MELSLFDLAEGVAGCVTEVRSLGAEDRVALRLQALGFVAGESVQVVARGMLPGGPLVVRVAASRFALRPSEAWRIGVRAAPSAIGTVQDAVASAKALMAVS